MKLYSYFDWEMEHRSSSFRNEIDPQHHDEYKKSCDQSYRIEVSKIIILGILSSGELFNSKLAADDFTVQSYWKDEFLCYSMVLETPFMKLHVL